MHRSIDGHNSDNRFILDYSKKFTTMYRFMLTIEHMVMIVLNLFIFKLMVILWIYQFMGMKFHGRWTWSWTLELMDFQF